VQAPGVASSIWYTTDVLFSWMPMVDGELTEFGYWGDIATNSGALNFFSATNIRTGLSSTVRVPL